MVIYKEIIVQIHDNVDPMRKLTYRELFEKTIKREIDIKLLGYNMVIIWEHQWNKQKKWIDDGIAVAYDCNNECYNWSVNFTDQHNIEQA